MKARFINNGKQQACLEYPNCNCEGHLVYEKHKKKQGDANE